MAGRFVAAGCFFTAGCFSASSAFADPTALLRKLLDASGETQSAHAVAAGLSERLAKVPDLNRPSASFTAATLEPLAFAAPVLALAQKSEAASPRQALDLWAAEYAVERDCGHEPVGLPDSLEEAGAALLQVATDVSASHRAVLPEKDWRRLERNQDKLHHYLELVQPAHLSWLERRRLRRLIAIVDRADFGPLYCSARTMLSLLDTDWLSVVERLMRQHPGAEDAVILERETPLGSIVFAGRADNIHRGDAVLAIFDLGGDDIYAIESPAGLRAGPQLLADFAGNDRYESTRPGGIASGVGRVSLLVDMAGDDRYRAHSLTQGAALLGVGMLHDRQGSDEYFARNLAQGMALGGLGLLLDETGDDRYELFALGQGLGFFVGLGALFDGAGNDLYRALGGRPTLYGDPGLSDAWAQGTGVGLRGVASGGIGLLADASGSDSFDAGAFAQGGGYYRATGILLDLGQGGDVFTGTRYSQAWGAHGGLGFLDNRSGNDRYLTRHSAAIGLAWDYSLAWFRDGAGDDEYRVGDFSLGASAHGSVAWFTDDGGSDSYAGTRPARRDEGGPNLSLFLDSGTGENRLESRSVQITCRLSDSYGFEVWGSTTALPKCQPE